MKYVSSFLLAFLIFVAVPNMSFAATETIRIYAGSGDGLVGVGTFEALDTWSAARSYTGIVSYVLDDTSVLAAVVSQFIQPYDTYRIYRSSLPFDMSVIPEGAEIESASLHLYGYNSYGLQEEPVCLVSHTRSNMSNLDWSDYSLVNFGATELASSDTSLVNDQYNVFVLNSAGITHVNSAEYIAIGIRTQKDCMDVDPGPSHDRYSAAWNSSEAEGADTDPYLEVTYSFTDEVETQEELIARLVEIVENDIHAGAVQNAYRAHVKKLLQFSEGGQTEAFGNQLNALFKKVNKDLQQGQMVPALADQMQVIIGELMTSG
jgi:hypothetical protein